MAQMDFESVRAEFPVLERCVYLNHAACSPTPLRTFNAMKDYAETVMHTGGAEFALWNEKVESVRACLARLLKARPTEIAFVPNTSAGILAVAHGVAWRRGDNCVINDLEFPANVYPWKNLVWDGIEVKIVKTRRGKLRVEDVEKRIDARTRLVAVSFVEYANGFRNDVAAFGDLCQRKGVYFFVDAIQGLGALDIDVKNSRIHFLAAGGHKWLLGPRGSGVFYCAEEVLDELQLRAFSWTSVVEPENFSDMAQKPKPSAARFEAGTPNLGGILGLGASAGLIEELGTRRIEERILELTDSLAKGLASRGYEVLSPWNESERSGILLFRASPRSPEEICAALGQKGIIVAVRNGGVRVSPHYYNNVSDIQRFLEALP